MEAEELADRIAIIHEGRVEQVGTRDEVLLYPCNDIVAEFVGRPNLLDCRSITDIGHGLIEALCGDLRIILPNEGATIRKVAIFPRDIYIAAEEPPGPGLNRFKGRIAGITRVSTIARIALDVDATRLFSEVPSAKLDEMGISEGDYVHVLFKMRGIRFV
jgi:ABC-type Fe3+/spermidine/putrescine transport system ATPase subunit